MHIVTGTQGQRVSKISKLWNIVKALRNTWDDPEQSCILHLISIAHLDKKAQCPICHCGVKRDELRSIISGEETMPKSGVKLDFVKMTCSKDSINPSVVTSTDDDNDWLDRYQRLIPVSRDNLIDNLLEREQAELAVQRAECEDSEIPFIEQEKRFYLV